jgi:uncharacterized DUF497 family protein
VLDLSRIETFDWDEGNARKSGEKHGVSQGEAEQLFFNDPLIAADIKHSKSEPRYHALGASNEGRLLHVTFTLRRNGTAIRVISARPMSEKERAFYGEEI